MSKGVDIKTLQYIIGHAQASTLLDIYTHFSQEAWDAAAQILDADFDDIGDTEKHAETSR